MDTTSITKAMTFAEKLRNNVLAILGVAGSALIAIVEVLSAADFSTTDGIVAAIPAMAALIARAQAFGPVTVAKLAEQKRI